MLNTKKKKKKKYYYFIFGLLNALNYIKFLQMTEQVIDIRDRIEKMRTQIDGSLKNQIIPKTLQKLAMLII